MTKIVSIETREESPEEAVLRIWFDEQEKATVSNLEAGARQIIQLVSVFYGVIFGVVSLGADQMEASLSSPLVVSLSIISILSLLVALLAALVVVVPLPYRYRSASLSDEKVVYQKMVKRKSNNLLIAATAFGIGLFAFALLIFAMLYYR